MKQEVVLYPSPGMGHLVSLVELGKLILRHHPTFSITVLITKPPFDTGATAEYVARVASQVSAITFHELPPADLNVLNPNLELLIFEWLSLCKPHVSEALLSISEKARIKAFIMDFFCCTALEVARGMGIASYIFFTSGAGFLDIFFYFPELHKENPGSFTDLDRDLVVPGIPPFPPRIMPTVMQDKSQDVYDWCMYYASTMPKADGILVNTFEQLEPLALKALAANEFRPGVPMPKIYCVGPLITVGDADRSSEVLAWLDTQPEGSVVFLCFGSVGRLSATQIREIAIGLESQRQRFLWVVRSPPTEDPSRKFLPPADPDLDALLPEGFLERTSGRGMVVKNWAPQVAVLRHSAVGGFVTHCGWNSILESICAGVPMAAWPLYAEQESNAFMMVGALQLSVRLERDDNGFVKAEALARCLRELMETESGKRLRERTTVLKDGAAKALSEGGTSLKSLELLVKAWDQAPN
ncbi:anthocyanidin 5,3-O-glucosyltransferase [Amborella trichopoda]|uniref:Glycosyltransferase n=1 Tax=Amborella trichopoda TaxID=13333 RepID=W1PZW0_AMBTC|nr:anthocyanidin 5,3-O-glucosyltransferase [Amborella trichopoda]ERN13988.1 hypothetical protein AMTR_s00021p00175420 [Amborella trichopoda]|eukprot:XP_006852521.1 anthocyanidin 5,3-O-glucosyltransferase [Amborella trichopoda]